MEPTWLLRWRQLIGQIAAEEGSQKLAGRRLGGFHQTTIGGWIAGPAAPKLDDIQTVMTRLRLPLEYLSSEAEPDYRQWVADATGRHRRVSAALAEFAETDEWRSLNRDQQRTLRDFVLHGAEPTLDTYRGLALLVRTTTRPIGTEMAK